MDIHYLPTLLISGLFIGYTVLWKLKSKELLKSSHVRAEVIETAVEPSQFYFNQLQRIMKFSCILFIGIHAFPHTGLPGSEPNPNLNLTSIKVIGFLIGIFGLGVCRVAQVTMGNSWRVGIDQTSRTGLVSAGIFRLIRNPTYAGLFLLCAGVLMIHPTALFSHWVLAFVLMMEFQVRKEEEYLTAQYGEEYTAYRNRTKRYIPYLY